MNSETKNSEELLNEIKHLKQKNLRLNRALKGTDLAVWDWNIQTNEVQFNERWASMLGYSLKELSPEVSTWSNLVHPKDLDRVEKELQLHLEGKTQFYKTQHRIRTKSGEYIWIQDMGKIFEWDEEGRPLRAVGTHLDITEQKNIENSLRNYEFALNNIADEVFWIDEKGDIIRVNNRAAENLGYSKAELTHQHAKDIDPKFNAERWAIFWDQIKQNESYTFESLHQRKDGTTYPVEISVSYLAFDDEEYAVAVARDIQERKKLELQLIQSQKMEAIGRLAGGIAHDFNNILTIIKGFTELTLEDKSLSLELQENLQEIINASASATALTKQLLAFSTKQVLQLERVDLNEILSSMKKFLNQIIGDNISLEIILENQPLIIEIDVNQMKQVIINLIINASEAIPKSGKIWIKTSEIYFNREKLSFFKMEIPPGDYVLLSIKDNGIGMDKKTKNHLFEPFFSTKKEKGGTGLGLSTVYGIIRQVQGYITVYSEEGIGTEFKLYFPLRSKQVNSKAISEKPKALVQGKETILLVEDNKSVRNLVKKGLEKYGYTVIPAQEPRLAMKFVNRYEESLDLIITDMVMPNMNGLELFDRIKKTHPELPFIFISGYTGVDLRKDIRINPETQFIQKPFTSTEIAEKVQKILSKSKNTNKNLSIN